MNGITQGEKTAQRQFAKPPCGLTVLLMCGNENSPETIRKTALRAYCFADVLERKQPRDNSQNRPTGLLFCSLWGSRPIALQKQTFTSKLDQSVLCKSILLWAV